MIGPVNPIHSYHQLPTISEWKHLIVALKYYFFGQYRVSICDRWNTRRVKHDNLAAIFNLIIHAFELRDFINLYLKQRLIILYRKLAWEMQVIYQQQNDNNKITRIDFQQAPRERANYKL